MSASLLLVGLGNPGERYARHRHNVGFMAVDAIADAHGFGARRAKYQGEVREGVIESSGIRVRTVALKPQTFMNDSGRSVAAAMRFLNLEPKDVVVFHDELDLAAGKVKAKLGGGTAGHNGLRSIDDHIGPEFRRVRIGIGHPGERERERVYGHVLSDFAKADHVWLSPLLDAIAACAPVLIEGDARFTSALALKLAPPKPPKPKPVSAEPDRAKPERDS
jgi:PTH1 family peptidyl-tRNA hydrolase